jgi:TnpA family transposase
MNDWQSTYLGRGALQRDLSGFEIEAFFTYSESERRVIDDERRTPALKLALALQIGFLRMTGRLLEALRMVPPALWRHLGVQFDVEAPDLASLRTMYRRRRTLFEHQDLACAVVGFHSLTEAQRRALVRAINAELSRTSDRQRLLQFARRWLYDHKQIIPRERELRAYIAKAIRQHEATLVGEIVEAIDPALLVQWKATIIQARENGATVQSWLWAPPAKHSTRQIDQVLERIELLTSLKVDQHLGELPEAIVRRYARRLASRAPAVAARITEPTRTIEVACFLRYCLMISTDHLLWMVRRRVADLWRKAVDEADAQRVDYARLYQQLLGEVSALAGDGTLSAAELQQKLNTVLATHREHRGPNRAQIIRDQLMEEVRPVRALLKALTQQPWKGAADHPLLTSLQQLNAHYDAGTYTLPVGTDLSLGRVWRKSLKDDDRAKAFAAAEVGTLLNLRRALRNGSVWIDHSLSFRSRESLFIPPAQWQKTRRAHYRRLHLPQDPGAFLEPLIERAKAGVQAVSKTAAEGILRVDDELHLAPLEPLADDPKMSKLRTALDRRVGEAQLPELILAVDAEVHFSWIMLGREPRSSKELLMVYAGILAHGTALSAAETARMIPQLSAALVRQAMKWASDERRLAQACSAVLAFMHRHPISTTWGRADLASSDMMSMETSQRVFVARNDPRRLTPSVGIYSHTRDRWGISYAQPMVLNDRQAGAASEGVVRDERWETAQLAVDTHGYTDVAMTLARGVGLDLCPRLKELSDRHLFLPRGSEIPENLKGICHATIDPAKAAKQWDSMVHLFASVHSGYSSAIHVLARYGSAARGDPLYEAMVQVGKLLRTVFLCDYFVNEAFRRELLRVLNRGEAVNALKRSIYVGRVSSYQAKQHEEMQAVADALSLLANLVMAWNTMKMQSVLDHWNARRSTAVPPELIGRIAPTRTEGINLRGVFTFPIEQYRAQLLPSLSAAKSRAFGG